MSDEKRKIDVDDLLARHLGKPVHQKPRQGHEVPPDFNSTESKATSRPATRALGSASAHATSRAAAIQTTPMRDRLVETSNSEVRHTEQIITKIGADIENMRVAMELMVEQIGKMVSLQTVQMSISGQQTDLQRQQIEAVAQLAPLVAKSQEAITGSVKKAVSSINDLQEAQQRFVVSQLDDVGKSPGNEVTSSAAPGSNPPSAVVKRGRGRPRKVPLVSASTQPNVPITDASEGAARRPRGRPRKVLVTTNNEVLAEAILPLKRGRGRPRKILTGDAVRSGEKFSQSTHVDTSSALPAKRPRGRPRKIQPQPDSRMGPHSIERDKSESECASDILVPLKRGRGRPRKNSPPIAVLPDHVQSGSARPPS